MTDSKQWAANLESLFHNTIDLIKLDINVCGQPASILYMDGLTDKRLMSEALVKPLTELQSITPPYYDILVQNLATVCPISCISPDIEGEKLASGMVLLKISGSQEVFCMDIVKYPTRAISEPPTSSVLKGPREGFVEDLKSNMTMIRRKLRTADFVMTQGVVGKRTATKYTVCYLEGIADQTIVDSVKKRLESIDIDGVPDSSYIAKLLEERPSSLFKQIGTTEKPDILMAKLLEGRVGIMVDGSPMVLTLPFLMLEDFQDSQDYIRKTARATLTRWLRLTGVVLAIFLPAFFVAVQEFQYQMLPIKFLLTIINVTSGIPLTPTIEMLVVIIVFEILNEASVRMPRYVGMALSIVGALVLGDTAVKAGLLSSPTVLISALSSTGLYCVPDQTGAFSVFRIIFVILAGVLGLYGLVLCFFAATVYLVNLNSYGTPYLAPYAPLVPSDLKDTLIKATVTDFSKRPESINDEPGVRYDK